MSPRRTTTLLAAALALLTAPIYPAAAFFSPHTLPYRILFPLSFTPPHQQQHQDTNPSTKTKPTSLIPPPSSPEPPPPLAATDTWFNLTANLTEPAAIINILTDVVLLSADRLATQQEQGLDHLHDRLEDMSDHLRGEVRMVRGHVERLSKNVERAGTALMVGLAIYVATTVAPFFQQQQK